MIERMISIWLDYGGRIRTYIRPALTPSSVAGDVPTFTARWYLPRSTRLPVSTRHNCTHHNKIYSKCQQFIYSWFSHSLTPSPLGEIAVHSGSVHATGLPLESTMIDSRISLEWLTCFVLAVMCNRRSMLIHCCEKVCSRFIKIHPEPAHLFRLTGTDSEALDKPMTLTAVHIH